jgi:hypothetical protein
LPKTDWRLFNELKRELKARTKEREVTKPSCGAWHDARAGVCQRALMISNMLEGMEHEEAAPLAGLSRSAAYEWRRDASRTRNGEGPSVAMPQGASL